jgi:putative transposase
MALVSRLRCLVLSDRFFFVTCRLSRKRRILSKGELDCLAEVIAERHRIRGFLVTAWVFLPDHWHAIICPHSPLTISEVMEAIKVSSTRRINRAQGETGILWQSRFFDRALRTVKEYIHWNPVKAELLSRAEGWTWSSAGQYMRSTAGPAAQKLPLTIDRVELPVDQQTRI